MLKKLNIGFEYVTTTIILIAIVAVIGLVTYKASSKPNPNKNIQATAKHAQISDQYIIGFSGHGNEDQIIDLREGLAQYKFAYNSNTNFDAKIIDQNGEVIHSVSGPAGDITRNENFIVPATGQYFLDIKCDGDWAISRK